MPVVTLYDEIQQSPLSLPQFNDYFRMDQFFQVNSTDSLMTFLSQQFIPTYYSQQQTANTIPLQTLIIAQQRTEQYNCNGTFIECNYGFDEMIALQNYTPFNRSQCLNPQCSEFQENQTLIPRYTFNGHYGDYSDFAYFFEIAITDNWTKVLYQVYQNGWLDSYSEALLILSSSYDIQSNQQVSLNLLIELPSNKQPMYLKQFITQLSFIDQSDPFHTFVFTVFIIIVTLKIFRSLLELTYIFSRFNMLYQLYNMCALLIFLIQRVRIMILRYSPGTEYLIFPQKIIQQVVSGNILSINQQLAQGDLQTVEDFSKMLLWLGYPFTFLQFSMLFMQFQWMQSYESLQMRTFPGIVLASLLGFLMYFTAFFPQNLLGQQSISNANSSRYNLYILTKFFITDTNTELTTYQIVIKCFQLIMTVIILAYVMALSIESFRKASIMEMNYDSRYDKDIQSNLDLLNQKITRVLQLVKKLFIKEKQKEKPQQDQQSQIIYDDELNTDEARSFDKILIIFEIQDQFLEEIARYKAKKENNIQSMKLGRKKPVGTIIGQLMQKSKQNSRLQGMLSRYQQQEEYILMSDEVNTQPNIDFANYYREEISKEGVTIMQFFVIHQVIKFLEMLLRLRPEFLSLNAEGKIRILFYINSDQVEEDDVYKVLSFLIVSLAKQHLNYPILLFSTHQDWYIEKAQYLKLKKFYKNIFSTLDVDCALCFSQMSKPFSELQTMYSKQKQYYEKENEEISHSFVEEDVDKSDIN